MTDEILDGFSVERGKEFGCITKLFAADAQLMNSFRILSCECNRLPLSGGIKIGVQNQLKGLLYALA